MARKGGKNTILLGLLLLVGLIGISWYHKRIMEGFQDSSEVKKAFEKFTDEQKAAFCSTFEEQRQSYQTELDTIKNDSTKAERIEELTTSLKMINDNKKTYNC